MKVIANELAIINVRLSDDDMLLYILNGIDPKFKEIVAYIRSRNTSISYKNLRDKLAAHEAGLKQDNTTFAAHVITANVTHSSRQYTSNCSSRFFSSYPK